MGPAGEIEEIGLHVLRLDHTIADRLEKVAALFQGASFGVAEHAGTAHHLIVGLAHGGFERADAIHMGARLQPCAFDQRRRGEGRGGNDIGLPDRCFTVVDRFYRQPLGLEFGG